MAATDIKHVFVLMLENRSFDHMLGFSGIPGINGLTPNSKSNNDPCAMPVFAQTVNPPVYQLDTKAGDADPGHELYDTFRQLTGQKIADNTFPQTGYSGVTINNSGFVMDYAQYTKTKNPEKIMYCFSPDQVPVITTLAKEFAVCDCWYSSLPGPTVPNRLFVHAGTSGGLDESIGMFADVNYLLKPISFPNGTIYGAIDKAAQPDLDWHIYKDGPLALTLLLDDVRKKASTNVHKLDDMASNLLNYKGKRTYNFIEPHYSIADNYKTGNSQHPMGDVREGEKLIKKVYDIIRGNDDVWNSCLFIIMYDEHGGFYDHVAPPPATPTNDNPRVMPNKFGFKFDQYGIRVPAIFVSPFIEKGTLLKEIQGSGKHYDHTSVIRSVCQLWGLPGLTPRDQNAQDFLHLFTLNQSRFVDQFLLDGSVTNSPSPPPATVADTSGQPDDNDPPDNMLEAFVHVAVMNELESEGVPPTMWPTQAQFIVSNIKTKLQARQFIQYMDDKGSN